MTLTAQIGDQEFTIEGDWVQDLRDLHAKMQVREHARTISPELLRKYIQFRIDMLQEEVTETNDALAANDAQGVVDGLIDLIVFAIGTLDVLEIDSYEAWARVRDANMAKEPGIKEGRPNPYGFPDFVKPAGWIEPRHDDNIGRLKEIV
jgi:predicted HAD superfamily Cof-like phosphohydrolase